MDTLAPLSMKGVASYENWCELQCKRITSARTHIAPL